jgi:membrane associated rhomboid family serine protease
MRLWLLWAVLSASSLAGVWATGQSFAVLGATPPPETWPWSMPLRMQVMPLVGILGLAAPVLAAVALVAKRWRTATLSLLAVVAVAQFAYLALEAHWGMLPPHISKDGING